MVSNDLENSLKNEVHIRKTLTNLKSRRNGWHVSAITLRWLPLLANWQIVLDPEDGGRIGHHPKAQVHLAGASIVRTPAGGLPSHLQLQVTHDTPTATALVKTNHTDKEGGILLPTVRPDCQQRYLHYCKTGGASCYELEDQGLGGGGPPLPRCGARGQGVSAELQVQPQDGGRVKMHRFSFVSRTRPRIVIRSQMCNCSFSGAPRAGLNVVDADTFTI
nr:uncharacterized protein LOC112916574 [Vulpes vulpes]